jgi:hypothetical protein
MAIIKKVEILFVVLGLGYKGISKTLEKLLENICFPVV